MKYLKNKFVLLSALFLLGGLWAFTMRFMLVERTLVHHHANFAIYIDGERDQLENFTFYEEVAACSPKYSSSPKSRVHLHDQEAAIVHVHAEAVTWGNLFENIEYSITNKVLQTDAGVSVDGADGKKLRYILNGKVTRGIAGRLISSEDVLLVDYSSDSEQTLLLRYAEVPKNAGEYNQKDDPASCQGGAAESFNERIKRTLGFED